MSLIQVKLVADVLRQTEARDDRQGNRCHGLHFRGNMRQVTWVVIEEVKSGEWGIGGQALTAEAIKALAAGKD
jgi:4-oxalocrotonate tautomerase